MPPLVPAERCADPDYFHRHSPLPPSRSLHWLATVVVPCFLPILVSSGSEPSLEYEPVGIAEDHQANQQAGRVRDQSDYDHEGWRKKETHQSDNFPGLQCSHSTAFQLQPTCGHS